MAEKSIESSTVGELLVKIFSSLEFIREKTNYDRNLKVVKNVFLDYESDLTPNTVWKLIAELSKVVISSKEKIKDFVANIKPGEADTDREIYYHDENFNDPSCQKQILNTLIVLLIKSYDPKLWPYLGWDYDDYDYDFWFHFNLEKFFDVDVIPKEFFTDEFLLEVLCQIIANYDPVLISGMKILDVERRYGPHLLSFVQKIPITAVAKVVDHLKFVYIDESFLIKLCLDLKISLPIEAIKFYKEQKEWISSKKSNNFANYLPKQIADAYTIKGVSSSVSGIFLPMNNLATTINFSVYYDDKSNCFDAWIPVMTGCLPKPFNAWIKLFVVTKSDDAVNDVTHLIYHGDAKKLWQHQVADFQICNDNSSHSYTYKGMPVKHLKMTVEYIDSLEEHEYND